MRRKFYEQSVGSFSAQQMRGFHGRRATLVVCIASHQNATHIGDLKGKFDKDCEMCQMLKVRQDRGEK